MQTSAPSGDEEQEREAGCCLQNQECVILQFVAMLYSIQYTNIDMEEPRAQPFLSIINTKVFPFGGITHAEL